MKAPDKIYAKIVDGRLVASRTPNEIFGEYFPEYIRKDALLGKIDEIIATKPDNGGLAVEVAAQAVSDIREIIMSM